MKKHYALLAAGLITGLWASPASAMEQYVSGNIGMSWVNDINNGALKYSLDSGTTVLGAIGIRCPQRDCRLEAEVGYQTNSINTISSSAGTSDYRGDVHVWSLLANGYYNIYDGKGFKPLNLLYFRGQCEKSYLQSKGDIKHDTDRQRESQTVQQRVQGRCC